MAYFETGGLNFWEVLGLAILFIWAVNRYFRKRNEADDERAAIFPDTMNLGQPSNKKLADQFIHMELMDAESRRCHDELVDEMSERAIKYCHTGRFD
jgi:hypothetical protein